MEIKTNQKNAAGQCHGYWEEYHNIMTQSLYRVHSFNDVATGYYDSVDPSGGLRFKCHFLNNVEIGCEQYRNSQYYYNKLNKKFGEEIKWK